MPLICAYMLVKETLKPAKPMISICLPVYNFIVTELANELISQAQEYNIDIEILIFDDASLSYFKERNAKIAVNPMVSYLELEQNLGRSKIRNRLADFARGNWLLFMDCDVIPANQKFLATYNSAINGAPVICGGIAYGDKPRTKELQLRWKYGIKRESKIASRRQMNPYASFLSGNFMIRKDVFNQIRFNERMSGYGHEDTLFGLDLKTKKIPIHHINNPIIHLGLEPCSEYLRKSEQGIINLVKLMDIVPDQQYNLKQNIKLLKFYCFLRRLGLTYPMQWVFTAFNPLIKKFLCNKRPSLFLFDFYKLGLISQVFVKSKKEVHEIQM